MNPVELSGTLRRIGKGSSLNWVIGHIVSSRGRICDFLGLDEHETGSDFEAIRAVYGKDTQPDTAGELPLARLLELLERTQILIEQELPRAKLEMVIDSPFGHKTVAELVNFFAWHEGYHAGQVIVFKRWLEG